MQPPSRAEVVRALKATGLGLALALMMLALRPRRG
jgi:hypothetical protein